METEVGLGPVDSLSLPLGKFTHRAFYRTYKDFSFSRSAEYDPIKEEGKPMLLHLYTFQDILAELYR